MNIFRFRASRDDLLILRMGIDTLLECVRQTETWSLACGDVDAVRRTKQLSRAILMTRRKFFPDVIDTRIQIDHARVVAEGLREAAKHCKEGQAALQTRLTAGAEVIERLCRLQEVQP